MFNRRIIRAMERQLQAKDEQIKRLTELVAGQAGVPVDRPLPNFLSDPWADKNPDQIPDPHQLPL